MRLARHLAADGIVVAMTVRAALLLMVAALAACGVEQAGAVAALSIGSQAAKLQEAAALAR